MGILKRCGFVFLLLVGILLVCDFMGLVGSFYGTRAYNNAAKEGRVNSESIRAPRRGAGSYLIAFLRDAPDHIKSEGLVEWFGTALTIPVSLAGLGYLMFRSGSAAATGLAIGFLATGILFFGANAQSGYEIAHYKSVQSGYAVGDSVDKKSSARTTQVPDGYTLEPIDYDPFATTEEGGEGNDK